MWNQKAEAGLEAIVKAIKEGSSVQQIATLCNDLDFQLGHVNTFKVLPDGGEPTMLNFQVVEVQRHLRAIAEAISSFDEPSALLAAKEAFAVLATER